MTAACQVTMTRTAAQVLVDQLRIQGVSHVFCVPGEILSAGAGCAA